MTHAGNGPERGSIDIGPRHPVRALSPPLVGRDHPEVSTETNHEFSHITLESLHDGQREDDEGNTDGNTPFCDAHHRSRNALTRGVDGHPARKEPDGISGTVGHAMQGNGRVSLRLCAAFVSSLS